MSRLSFSEALDFVPDDLPDGAYWAMVHEMAGLEYGDGFDELLVDAQASNTSHSSNAAKAFSCQIEGCGKRFGTKAAKRHHRRDAHGVVA